MSTSNTTSTDQTRSRSRDDRASRAELLLLWIAIWPVAVLWVLAFLLAIPLGWCLARLRATCFAAWRGVVEGRR